MPREFDFTVPGSCIRRKVAFDDDGRMWEHIDQTNMQDVLDLNASMRNAERATSSLWGGKDYVRIASIPMELVEAWLVNEGINIFRASDEDMARLMAKLNDRHTWGALRTDQRGVA